jgi:hypothetical protein
MTNRPADNLPTDLSRLDWHGSSWYRVLSYYFSVRWTHPDLGHQVSRVLGGFAVPRDTGEERSPPTPGLPVQYSLAYLGSHAGRSYGLYYGRDALIYSSEPGQTLRHLFWHINAETVRHTGSFLLIHAGVAVTPSGTGIVFPAGSGAGKTTLVAGLVRSGFGYLSDEAAAIDPATGRVHPYPKALNVKTRFLFDRYPDLESMVNAAAKLDHSCVLPEELRSGAVAKACSPGFVVAYRYQNGSETELEPMTKGEAALVLAKNVMNLPFYRSRALPVISTLAERAECYRLVTGDLTEAIDALTDLVGTSRPSNQPRPTDRIRPR